MASENNKGVNNLESSLYKHEPGKIVISNRSGEKATAVIIEESGVTITNSSVSGGARFDNNGIALQGVTTFTSKGETIKKGEYSENPKSSKIFTYKETVLVESVPKDLMSKMAGQAGMNLNTGMDGGMPIITDMSGGTSHSHTISMKHVHRIEPAYLYRVPSMLEFIKGAMSQLQQFFKL